MEARDLVVEQSFLYPLASESSTWVTSIGGIVAGWTDDVVWVTGSMIYAATFGCDFGTLDWSEAVLYSPSFVFLWTRPFKMVTKAKYGAIGAIRKAGASWSGQLFTQINAITETPIMILD